MSRPKTIFCDIDGTLWDHVGDITSQVNVESHKMLENTSEALNRWDKLGYRIILTTGRRESMREATVHHLKKLGIVYDILIMGLGGGPRVLINDRKPNNSKNTAFAMNLIRNEGIKFYDFDTEFCTVPQLTKEKKVDEICSREVIEFNDNYIVTRVELFPTLVNVEDNLEYHKLLKKTITVFEGEILISVGEKIYDMEKKLLKVGDFITIDPKKYYFITTEKGCKYFETTSPEIWE